MIHGSKVDQFIVNIVVKRDTFIYMSPYIVCRCFCNM